jgi:uncharacterized protein YkwD
MFRLFRKFRLLPALLVLAATVLGPTAAAAAPADDAARVVDLVNAVRASHGLPALRWEDRLAGSAADYALTMASVGFFSHFEDDGTGMVQRDEAHGYTSWNFLGENLARDKATPEEVVAAWLSSPTHLANLLAIDACQVGVGLATDQATHYWAMETGC